MDQRELMVRTETIDTRPVLTGKDAVESVAKMATKDSNTLQQKEDPKKIARHQCQHHALRELSAQKITMKLVHLGSDSYGSCYLGVYRGIDVIIKDLHVQQVQCESCEDAECEVPLLFGVCTKGAPYRLIM